MSELREKVEDNPEVVHEESDVNVRAILLFGAGLAGVALAVHVFLWVLQGYYTRQTERVQTMAFPIAAGQEERVPPGPRLQDNPQEAMRELRARQEGLLSNYSWISKNVGTVRIPIEEAMRIVVERGLPVREGAK
jgi:hypothetical protein